MASSLFGPGRATAQHTSTAERARREANLRENRKAAGQAAGRGKRRI